MNKSIKTKENTSYSIDKYTYNIKEVTTYNGYVSSNVVHFTTLSELHKIDNILKEFENKLKS